MLVMIRRPGTGRQSSPMRTTSRRSGSAIASRRCASPSKSSNRGPTTTRPHNDVKESTIVKLRDLPRRTTAIGLSTILGMGLTFSQVGPAGAQAQSDTGITGPTTLIEVIPGPVLPPPALPPAPAVLPPLPPQYSQPVGPFTMYMD